MPLTPVQKFAITIGAALAVLGLFGAASYYYASHLVAADRIVQRANANMAAALRVVVARADGERLAKAYIVRPDSATRRLLQGAQVQVEDALDVMRRGTEDNPREFERVRALASGAAQQFDAFRAAMLLRDRASADSARRALSSEPSAQVADSLMALVTQIREEELRVLGEQTRLQNAHSTSVQRVILAAMVLAFLLAGVALQPMRAHVATRLTTHIVRQHASGTGEPPADEAASARADLYLPALQRLSADLATASDPGSVAQALVRAAGPLQPAVVAVLRSAADGGAPLPLAASPPNFSGVLDELTAPVAAVVRTGEATVVASREARERQWGAQAALDSCGARGAVLLSPLVREGSTLGVLLIAHAAEHRFDEDELQFAATLGRFGGSAMAS